MAKRRKVILFLVEGSSELTALVQPFARYYEEKARVEGEALRCDVTTISLFRSAPLKVCKDVKETVRSFVLDVIDTKRLYRWEDLDRVIQIVDLDGAFVPDEAVVENSALSGVWYGAQEIECPDASLMRKRNAVKSAALRKLVASRTLTYRGRSVPYAAYFMSRNLEHALFGVKAELDDAMKRRLAEAFARDCEADPAKLPQTLRDEGVLVPGDYRQTWKYVQQETRSLERGSNLALAL